jgi:hypothetical protein
MVRKVAGFAARWAMVVAGLGCGSGVSDEEAQLRCDQARRADSVCITDEGYQQCLRCQEECGDQCATLESCPVQFSCPK